MHMQFPDGTVIMCFQKGYLIGGPPKQQQQQQGGSAAGTEAAVGEKPSPPTAGEQLPDAPAAVAAVIVRPALVKVSMQ